MCEEENPVRPPSKHKPARPPRIKCGPLHSVHATPDRGRCQGGRQASTWSVCWLESYLYWWGLPIHLGPFR